MGAPAAAAAVAAVAASEVVAAAAGSGAGGAAAAGGDDVATASGDDDVGTASSNDKKTMDTSKFTGKQRVAELGACIDCNVEPTVHPEAACASGGGTSASGGVDRGRSIASYMKACTCCGKPTIPGKNLHPCGGCKQRGYCCKKCQLKDWPNHKKVCFKLRHTFVPGVGAVDFEGNRLQSRKCDCCDRMVDVKVELEDRVVNGGCYRRGYRSNDDDVLLDYPCPICLDNEDCARVNGHPPSSCHVCGQHFCGECSELNQQFSRNGSTKAVQTCPMCRATLVTSRSDKDEFDQMWNLAHKRSTGRHTSKAFYKIGRHFENGKGVKKNMKKALKFYKQAAALGDAEAEFCLGYCYWRLSEVVKQDLLEALKWFMLAAKQGHEEGLLHVGYFHLEGIGVPKNGPEAMKWFKKAAATGSPDAQSQLGTYYCHVNPDSSVQHLDYTAAFMAWLRKAAVQGHAMAQLNLGRQHSYKRECDCGCKDRPTLLNIDVAVMWLQLAGAHLQEQREDSVVRQTSREILEKLQKENSISTPPPDSFAIVVGLTAASSLKYNNRIGRIVAEAESGTTAKQGRVAVLLTGSFQLLSFKLKNLRVREIDAATDAVVLLQRR